MDKEKTIWVEIKMTLLVRVPADKDYPVKFVIEENSCPATGMVWSALNKIIKIQDKRKCCWGCALGGENKIVSKPKWASDYLVKLLTKEVK